MRDTLSWTQGGRVRTLGGVDTPHGDGFRWRGDGLLAVLASDWQFVELTESWAVTWFARASFGVTPEGMDIYGREPNVDTAPILRRIQADPRFAHLSGWYTT